MSLLVGMTYAGAVVASTLAWDASRDRPAHRPVAALLTFGLAADAARRALRSFVLAPAYAALNGAPATGMVRAVAHLDQALFLGYPAALAAVTLWIFVKRRPWPVLVGYMLTEIGLVATYPALRRQVPTIYLGFQLACLTVAVGSLIHWMIFRKNPPTVPHWTVALMVVVEIAIVAAGPWRLGLFLKWDLAQMAYCMLYMMLIVIQWGWSWTIRNSSSRS